MTIAHNDLLLRSKVQYLVRALGVFRSQTPCGRPISVSGAHALMVLKQSVKKQGLSQKDLQQSLNLDKSNITRLCANLERDGFITQEKSEEDARVRILKLTPKGKKLSLGLLEDSRKRFQKILANIPKEFHSQVLHSLDLLLNSLENEKIS